MPQQAGGRAGGPHLRQRLHRVLCVDVAQDDTQAEGALQLLDAVVDVLRLQQVVPAGERGGVENKGGCFITLRGSGEGAGRVEWEARQGVRR